MTKRDFVKERCDRAIEAFKSHELVDCREDRWRICKREPDGQLTNIHAAEIVSLWGGRLFVGGDIDDCVFAYHSYNDKVNHHRAKLEWIGKCQDVGYYVRQKATMGLTDGGKLVDCFDQQIAEYDLNECLKDTLEEMQEYDTSDARSNEILRIRGIFDEAKHYLDDPEMLRRHLYEAFSDGDCEWVSTVGMVVSYRVVYAWAAVRRLCELLDAKDANAV